MPQRQGHEVQRGKREKQASPAHKAHTVPKEKKAILGPRACGAHRGKEASQVHKVRRVLKEKKAIPVPRLCEAHKGKEAYPDRKGLQGQRVILPIRPASISLSSAFLNWKRDWPHPRKEWRSRFKVRMR